MSSTADVACLGALITVVDPEIFERMLACLEHGPSCTCWADQGDGADL